jgi:(p)ppGpp synthase/HD superfamily hydrolase
MTAEEVVTAAAAEEAVMLSSAAMDEDERRRFALQTLQVFVPLAHRLGMWYFKSELEQRCFAQPLRER